MKGRSSDATAEGITPFIGTHLFERQKKGE
jgi:hypothetical protein